MCEPARYLNGEPENLTAAAWDALQWLDWIKPPPDPDLRAKFERCRDILRKQLAPHVPPAVDAEFSTFEVVDLSAVADTKG